MQLRFWRKRKPKTKPAAENLDLASASEDAVGEADRRDKLYYLADYLQRLNLADYIRMTQRPKRLIFFNFLAGIARGFGMAIGFSILGALGFLILNRLNLLNLPVIGDLITQLVEYVEMARDLPI